MKAHDRDEHCTRMLGRRGSALCTERMSELRGRSLPGLDAVIEVESLMSVRGAGIDLVRQVRIPFP